jgi:hypothetical protein
MTTLHFHPTPSPIREPITKFGGQPVWLREPAWPLSRSTRNPMCFIAQIRLPASMQSGGQQMAYIFMTDDGKVDNTWNPEAGENAVILQPGPFTPIVDTEPHSTGQTPLARKVIRPTLWQRLQGKRGREKLLPVELAVRETPESSTPASNTEPHTFGTRIGGQPEWLQNEECPPIQDGKNWVFLAQIDSTCPAFDVNFGDSGVAYIFLREDGQAARMLWQCM